MVKSLRGISLPPIIFLITFADIACFNLFQPVGLVRVRNVCVWIARLHQAQWQGQVALRRAVLGGGIYTPMYRKWACPTSINGHQCANEIITQMMIDCMPS